MNISPTENEIKYIRDALKQFNDESVGKDGHMPLNIVEYDENGKLTTMWLTDSDDYIHQLFSVAVTLNDKENKIYLGEQVDGKYICDAYKGYENVYIAGVYAIDTSESAGWLLIPEPTTATLSLLALAGLAARRRRR